MGAGRSRFQRGPSFTKQFATNSSSTSSGAPASSALRSAFAIALRSTFSMCLAARFCVYFSVCSASCAFAPRIKSITSRAFCGDIRTCRASACASIDPVCVCTSAIALCLRRCGCCCRWCCAASWWCHARGFLERHPHAVALERTRRRKFSQLVPDHLLGHIHGNEFLSVVHGDGVPDHFRHNRRAPRPRFNHFLFVARVQSFYLDAQMAVHKRPFFQ